MTAAPSARLSVCTPGQVSSSLAISSTRAAAWDMSRSYSRARDAIEARVRKTETAPMTDASEQAGRAARRRAPRSAHAHWEPAPDRAEPVATLERQAETRAPGLVPVRYGRMARSPFAFYRGAAAIMAADLAATPVTGLSAQLCGDAHLANFGGFAAPDRSLVFDLNDFDETLPGPWEWDVKRLVASFEIAARSRE